MTRLSPAAYEVVQKMRSGFIEAGEEGWCGREHMTSVKSGVSLPIGRAGVRRCVLQRYFANHGSLPVDLVVEIQGVSATLRRDLVAVNDDEGYGAAVAMLDRLVTECAPVPSRAAVLEKLS